jgi:trehalose 6-phosphate phosphatase
MRHAPDACCVLSIFRGGCPPVIPFLPFEAALDVSRAQRPSPPSILPRVPGWALFLDLDGTLCPYETDPEQVALDRRQRALLADLAHCLDGAVCILSGREGPDLDRALGDLELPRCGEHGRSRAAPLDPARAAELDQVEARLRTHAAEHADAGVWVERKETSCALHYRSGPWLAERMTEAARLLSIELPGLRLLEGKCVLEFVQPDANKGTALRAFMEEPRFASRTPVAVGDDVTDEDAFAVAGPERSIMVGPRPSKIAQRLEEPAAVEQFVRRLSALV